MSLLQAICSASLTPRIRLDGQRLDWGTNKNTETRRGDKPYARLDLALTSIHPDSKPEEIDKINRDKLNLDPDYPQEEMLQIANSLIPPPTTEEMGKTTTQEKTDIGTDKDQQEGKDYEE